MTDPNLWATPTSLAPAPRRSEVRDDLAWALGFSAILSIVGLALVGLIFALMVSGGSTATAAPAPSPTLSSPTPSPTPRVCLPPKIGSGGMGLVWETGASVPTVDPVCVPQITRHVCADEDGGALFTTRVPSPRAIRIPEFYTYTGSTPAPTWQAGTLKSVARLIKKCVTPPPPAPVYDDGPVQDNYYGNPPSGSDNEACASTCERLNNRFNPICRKSWFC